jgi:hypothetical protein
MHRYLYAMLAIIAIFSCAVGDDCKPDKHPRESSKSGRVQSPNRLPRSMDDPNDDPIHMLGMPEFVSYHEIQVFHLHVEHFGEGYVAISMGHGKNARFDYSAYRLIGVAEERGYRIVDWWAVRANG